VGQALQPAIWAFILIGVKLSDFAEAAKKPGLNNNVSLTEHNYQVPSSFLSTRVGLSFPCLFADIPQSKLTPESF